MPIQEPFRFASIRKRHERLTEAELIEAEARFARLLDILADVAAQHSDHEASGDNRFDKSAPAPHDSSPPTTGS